MFLVLAALLIHPQLAPGVSLLTENSAFSAPAAISTSYDELATEKSSVPVAVLSDAASQPALESNAVLPDEPVPVTAMSAPAPIAFVKSGEPVSVSVNRLRAENRRKQIFWKGLVIASSGAATFDAWSTRHAITTYGAQELNPLLRPFAGNSSLYAAIQVAPALMDFAGRKMMYSRHSWMRRMWWAPQSTSFVSSLFCGAHNLSYR